MTPHQSGRSRQRHHKRRCSTFEQSSDSALDPRCPIRTSLRAGWAGSHSSAGHLHRAEQIWLWSPMIALATFHAHWIYWKYSAGSGLSCRPSTLPRKLLCSAFAFGRRSWRWNRHRCHSFELFLWSCQHASLYYCPWPLWSSAGCFLQQPAVDGWSVVAALPPTLDCFTFNLITRRPNDLSKSQFIK